MSKEYGKRLIPSIVDELALSDPERAVYAIPNSKDISKGFMNISARIFAAAVNNTAWWLESELGKCSSFKTIGYVGPHDLRYVLLILTCVKTGYKALILSPRNDIDASLAVLEASNCNIWVLPAETPQIMSRLITQRDMKTLIIPRVQQLLKDGLSENIDMTKHSKRLLGIRFVCYIPQARLSAGLVMNILINVFFGTCNVLGPVGIIPNLDLVDSLLEYAAIDAWSIVPSLVDEIGEDAMIVEKFKSSKFIVASGGPVNYNSASKLNSTVRVFNITGTTEGLFMGIQQVEREDWIYFSFHPWAGFEFREVEPGVYEHWAVRNSKHVQLFQGLFHTFPSIQEMSLKDLYTQHPTKPDLWRYKGRADDLLVLSNGEKIHPVGMEAVITAHPAVSGCLIVGTGKFQAAILLELKATKPSDAEELAVLVSNIYQVINRANSSAPSYAQIHREYIIFTKSNKPLIRTDKKTIKRRATIASYEKEIEDFYEERESVDCANIISVINTTSLESTVKGVRDVLIACLPAIQSIGLNDDIFNAGIDSLIAFRVARRLRAVVEKRIGGGDKRSILTPRVLYANPTISQLSTAVYELIHKSTNPLEATKEQQGQTQMMKELLTKYTSNLPQKTPQHYERCTSDGTTIILTGTTGSLGSYLLESLIRQSNIKKVYALNRSENGQRKQTETNRLRGLTVDWSAQKVEFLQIDLSKPKFGLPHDLYKQLLQQATHIIHNQWPVNFNWKVSSFESQIQGVRHLIDFSINSKHAAHLFFISTITTVSSLRSSRSIAEAPIEVLTTERGGYSSSKQVSELLLQDAADRSGIKSTICRVGQIAGPVGSDKGMWGKQEWLPSVIASSKYLGVLPSTLGFLDRVDWIPVDILADIITELSGVSQLCLEDDSGNVSGFGVSSNSTEADSSPNFTVYHAINLGATGWASLIPAVLKHISSYTKIVSWSEWLQVLENSESDRSAASLKVNPALKLIDFFKSVELDKECNMQSPILETTQALKQSKTMRLLEPVGEEWMEVWLRQWNF